MSRNIVMRPLWVLSSATCVGMLLSVASALGATSNSGGEVGQLVAPVKAEPNTAQAKPATAATTRASGPAAEIEVCRDQVASFMSTHAILFQSGSARMTEGTVGGLDELAAGLNACPEAVVHIEGHTDADGSASANLALSLARAEALVAALSERSVDADRLYAVGYGESLPVASNETPGGKQLNRRIVFVISEK